MNTVKDSSMRKQFKMIMKTIISNKAFTWYFCVVVVLIAISSIAFAGPILTIEDIDTASFPHITIRGSISKLDGGDSSTVQKNNFVILEDGQSINDFTINTLQSNDSHIAICLDSSKSLTKKDFDRLKKISLSFVRKGKGNRFLAYKFNDEVVTLCSADDTIDACRGAIESLTQHGKRTKLYNCLFTATEDLSQLSGKRSILLFTDGKDEGSYMMPQDVVANAREYKIPVYTVVPRKCSKSAAVSRLSAITKGKVFIASLGVEDTILQTIAARQILNGINYEIQFTTTKFDKATHSIEVQFKKGSVKDNDIQKVQYKGSMEGHAMPTDMPFIVLAGIVVLLVIALVIVILIFINRWKQIIELVSLQRIPKPVHRYYSALYEKDIRERKQEDTLLLATSPDYSYTNAWLVEKSGPQTGKKYPLIWDEVTIGRSKENTIVINDDAVSLTHAKIKKVHNSYYLFDCASDNGTYLNNKKLLRPKPLTDWDEIQIGRTTILFRGTKIKL